MKGDRTMPGTGPLENHKGLFIGMSVETNTDYNRIIIEGNGGIEGKILSFSRRDQPNPTAILDNGKEISVFWLQEKKTK
jgi:hypothetical protein